MSDAAALIAATAPGLVILAGAMWGIGSMIAAGSLVPNALIGIRTRATRRSREAWDAAHLAALPWLRRSAWAGALGAVLLLALLLGGDAGWVMPTAVAIAILGYLGCLGALVCGSVVAQRAAHAAA